MESINSIFRKNSFITRPTTQHISKDAMVSLVGKDILYPQKKIKNEMSYYIDILYNKQYGI